jgi:hypothetical protein
MGSGSKGGSGRNRAKDYYGTIGGVVCQGTVDELFAVIVDGAEVWPRAAQWAPGQNIALNALRSHSGRTWKCILAHNPSSSANAPPNATNWTPYSLPRSGDSSSITITGYGVLTIYWGTDTQGEPVALNPDAWALSQKIQVGWRRTHNNGIYTCKLAHTAAATSEPGVGATWQTYWGEKTVKHPPYKGVCYIVLDDFLFGRERLSAPNIEVVVGRKPVQSVITGDPTTLSDGQANVITALAEILTSRNGLGLAAATLDTTSWQATADYVQTKIAMAGASPLIDSQTTLRSVLDDCGALTDCWVRYNPSTKKIEAGVFKHGEVPASYTTLTVDDLADGKLPEFSADGWTPVKTATVVEFTDRARSYKGSSDKADDPRAFKVLGEHRNETLSRPWITRRPQALAHARETLRHIGRPQLSGSIVVRREKARTIRPGDWILLDIDLEPGGTARNQYFKVLARSIPYSGPITLTIDADETLAPTIVDVTTESKVEDELGVPAISNARIVEAPVALADFQKDHVLVLAERDSSALTGMEVYFDTATGGTFQPIGTQKAFAIRATLRSDYSSAATGDLEVTVPDQIDIDTLAEAVSDLNAEDDTLLAIVVKTDAGFVEDDADDYPILEVMSISAISLVSANTYDLTVLRGRQFTKLQSFVTADTEVWIIYRELLTPLTHQKFAEIRSNRINGDTPATGFFRLSPHTQSEGRDLADCSSIEYRWSRSSPAGPLLALTSPISSGSAYQYPPEWNSGTAYVEDDWVWRSGTAYKCILGHTNQVPPNATYWTTTGSPYPVDIPFAGTWTDPNSDLVAAQILVKKDGGTEIEDESETMAPAPSLTFEEDVHIAENGMWNVRLVGTDATGLVTSRTVRIDAKGSTTQVARPKFKQHGKRVKGEEWNLYGKLKITCRTEGATIEFRYKIAEDRDWVTGTAYTIGQKRWHNDAIYTCFANHTAGASTEPGVGASWTTVWKDSSATVAWVTATAYSVGDKRTNNGIGYFCYSAHTSGASTEPGVGASWKTRWIYADEVLSSSTDGLGAWHTYDGDTEGYDSQPYGWQPTDGDHREIIEARATKASYTDSEIEVLTIRFKRIGSNDDAP